MDGRGGVGAGPMNVYGGGNAGPSRWQGADGTMDGEPSPPARNPSSSPTSNPHSGLHPSSYGASFALGAFGGGGLDYSSSNTSSSLGMSISPPRWPPNSSSWTNGGGGFGFGGSAGASGGGLGAFGGGSYVGSLGGLGTSFGRERDRQLEAQYVTDFECCGQRLKSLHELLDHYEDEHGGVAPDLRAAVSASAPVMNGPVPGLRHADIPHQPAIVPSTMQQHSDLPQPPGMMDIEMDDAPPLSAPAAPLGVQTHPTPATFLGLAQAQQGSSPIVHQPRPTSQAPSPGFFNTNPAFRPPAPALLGGHSIPPSLLSFAQGPYSASAPVSRSSTPTPDQIRVKEAKKAQRKAERAALREADGGGTASDGEGEKRFPCPIEGCGKVYKQANGLKYHLTRSINSGHGNVAAMGGLTAFLAKEADSPRS